MATFGLVHGAWHGAWCWERLVPELAALGHRSLAVDLPIDNPAATLVDYARAAAEAFAGEMPIVVGHSMGGLVIPLVADMIPVRGLVYLAPVLRRPGKSLADDNADGVSTDMSQPGFADEVKRGPDGLSRWFTLAAASDGFYQDCAPADAAAAFRRLRGQGAYWKEPSPQSDWPKVPCEVIVCTEDRAINPAWQRRFAREWMNTEPIDFVGGHSPFLARPRELAVVLNDLARHKFHAETVRPGRRN